MKTKYMLLMAVVVAAWSCCSKPDVHQQSAEEFFTKVWNMYRVESEGLFSEYYPNGYKADLTYFNDGTKNSQQVSFLWPFSGISSSAILLAEHNKAFMPYLDTVAMCFEMYRDTTRTPVGYQAYPSKYGSVDRYYDDNGLVGIDYIDAYRVTGKAEYLQRAKEVMRFIMSGWWDEWGGGVSWLEGVKDQKPACSNGKAMVLALKLYQATGEEEYLETGKTLYKWISEHLRDYQANAVWNSWNTLTGTPDKTFYSYNTGTLIQAACRLYLITEQQSYLDDAESLGEGSYNHFCKTTEQGAPFFDDLTWFNVVLLRGYQELYDINHNPKYMDAMAESIDYAMLNYRDQWGLVYKKWDGKQTEDQSPKWLLDQACIPEWLMRVAIYKQER